MNNSRPLELYGIRPSMGLSITLSFALFVHGQVRYTITLRSCQRQHVYSPEVT